MYNNHVIKKVSDSYKKNLFYFIFGPMLKMVEAIFDLLIPLFMKAVIDLAKYQDIASIPDSNVVSRYLGSFIRSFGKWIPDNQYLSDALIGFTIIIVMGVVGFAITMVTQYIAARTAMKVGTEVRNSLFDKVQKLSKKEKEEIGQNKILTVLNADSYQVQQGVLIFIRLIVRAPFIILGALAISLLLNWKIGIVFACIIPLILVVVFVFMSHSSKEYIGIQHKLDTISTKVDDSIEGHKVIKAFGKEEYEVNDFKGYSSDYEKASIHVNKINSSINPLTFAIISVATILVVVIGGQPIINSSSDEGILLASTIIAEVAYLSQIFVTLVQLTNVVLILTKARVSAKRVNEILAVEPAIKDNPNALVKEINTSEPLFVFSNVSLKYESEGNNALEGISFALNKGRSLGIIGGTGSGKSSLVNLMERFIDSTGGEILYKGESIKDYRLFSLREEVALVGQHSSLLKGTIRNNLAMGKDYSDEQIIKALKDASAYEFVSQYSDFLDHEVVEGGLNFSGGQRQRLCIARALLKCPETIIFDSATSALDLLTEKNVLTSLEKNYQGISKIIVSQRVSSVKDCDLILLLDGGKLVASGSHQELLKSSNIYKEIYDTQVQKEVQ